MIASSVIGCLFFNSLIVSIVSKVVLPIFPILSTTEDVADGTLDIVYLFFAMKLKISSIIFFSHKLCVVNKQPGFQIFVLTPLLYLIVLTFFVCLCICDDQLNAQLPFNCIINKFEINYIRTND